MAKGAAKKAASSNASTSQILLIGFALSNAAQLLLRFGLFRSTASISLFLLYASTQAVALFLWSQLHSMGRQGVNLSEQGGLTPYLFDIIYVTWFCNVGAALISDKIWYLYLLIPGFAVTLLYSRLIVPYLLGGRDPIRSFFSRSAASAPGQKGTAAAQQATDGATSKRQQKLQKRADKGDPRVRAVQR
ncbi:hypothetical protein OC846_005207 [Tilletia horrida]|uniref:DUF788-domain-containing protein n=1 Tax=Tilletia horrida TaxID=155126 RepID=A0AAN6JW84_9BASI|nr:hypothetical protein OC846_005207 [Tilletia horrida]KAK0562333.1 hypothetical protein OC861_005373 [Tilletia horrida]